MNEPRSKFDTVIGSLPDSEPRMYNLLIVISSIALKGRQILVKLDLIRFQTGITKDKISAGRSSSTKHEGTVNTAPYICSRKTLREITNVS